VTRGQRFARVVFTALAVTATATSALAQQQRVGATRIVLSDYGILCQVYGRYPIDFKGNTALSWQAPPFQTDGQARDACTNAINLKYYLDTYPVETLDSVDNLTTAVREGRAGMLSNSRAHVCGTDGRVYDLFMDGTTKLHQQTLRHPNKRCKIGVLREYRRTGVGPGVIRTIGGL
jgi:hypothetical protein